MKVNVFSKETFIKAMESRNITDETVGAFGEYFICIDSTGGPWAHRYFYRTHSNVIRLVFDDVMADEIKWGNDVQHYFDAKAMVYSQAVELVDFIKRIPADSTINIHCTKGKSRSVAIASFINNEQVGNQHVLGLLTQAWNG